MKKLYLAAAMISFSMIASAQQKTQSSNLASDTLAIDITDSKERVARLEKEIVDLKIAQADMKKELVEIRSYLPVQKKKKPVVSRVGSKQLTWVEE